MSSPTWVGPFLLALNRIGTITGAAHAAGINYQTAHVRRKADGDFAAAVDEALLSHNERCEEELTRRAFGYEEPVVYQGQLSPVFVRDESGSIVLDTIETSGQPVQVPRQARNADGSLQWLTIKKFSDALLLAKVKATNKAYSTERTELSGPNGEPVAIDATTRAARLSAIVARVQTRQAFSELA